MRESRRDNEEGTKQRNWQRLDTQTIGRIQAKHTEQKQNKTKQSIENYKDEQHGPHQKQGGRIYVLCVCLIGY